MENHSPIIEGIKMIGVGKHGSQHLSKNLIEGILAQLQTEQVSADIRGAFFGALVIRGVTAEERRLEAAFTIPDILKSPESLIQALSPEAPATIKNMCCHLLREGQLDQKTAKDCGLFLFSDQPGNGARGLIASILRVRYETNEEYAGLLESLHLSMEDPFQTSIPEGNPVIQLAEPFNGVTRSYLITPLIANALRQKNYRVISLSGTSSGPKFGTTLLDLAQGLNIPLLKNNTNFTPSSSPFGWVLDQQDLSCGIARWGKIRRNIIKRPFLATLERLLNPCQAKILIASAFHPRYTEKMLAIGENAGYDGLAIVRHGLEGSMAFQPERMTKIDCMAKGSDGSYTQETLIFEASTKEGIAVEACDIQTNINLIKKFMKDGKTAHEDFNRSVTRTCEAIGQAVDWIKQQHR